jgi:hypothetical protein
MKTLKTLMVTVGLLVALAVPAFAQTTLNSTTLAAAVTATASQIQLASTSNISVGDRMVVVTGNVAREVMRVTAVNSPYVQVARRAMPLPGLVDTSAHASGSTVYTGARGRFYQSDVAGVCTSTAEAYLPHISLTSGFISQCSPAGVWYRLDQTFTQTCRMLLIADMVDQSCYTVDRPLVLVGATYVSKVAESAGTLTVRIMREQSTEAAASGDLLATAWNAVTSGIAAETVTSATLSATSSFLLLSAGERLGVDFTDDTAGELAGVTITFTLAPR